MTHLLTLLVVIPLAGLIPLFVFRRDDRAVKQVAVTTTAVEFALSLWMVAQFRVGEAGFQLVERIDWLPSLGIRYLVGVDGISVLLVPMTTLLTLIAVAYSSGGAIKTRIAEYMTAFLLLEVGMVGVFLALDLFLFYVFFELMLIPMYLIIGIWGGPRRIYSTLKFVLFAEDSFAEQGSGIVDWKSSASKATISFAAAGGAPRQEQATVNGYGFAPALTVDVSGADVSVAATSPDLRPPAQLHNHRSETTPRTLAGRRTSRSEGFANRLISSTVCD